VVAQVDRKFLACVLRAPAPATLLSGDTHRRLLFLIDQHAADERIRVETYLRELASGFFTNCRRETAGPLDAIPLVKPTTEVYILLTAAERQALASSTTVQLVFARWGITFDLPPTLPADCDVQTRVLSVPSVVAERLLGRRYLKEGPAELTELIKSYLAWLDEEGGAESVCAAAASAAMGRGADFGRAEDDSMGALRFCPREILDLINSKACRGQRARQLPPRYFTRD
jgi:DNA mismatch repair protein MLH3